MISTFPKKLLRFCYCLMQLYSRLIAFEEQLQQSLLKRVAEQLQQAGGWNSIDIADRYIEESTLSKTNGSSAFSSTSGKDTLLYLHYHLLMPFLLLQLLTMVLICLLAVVVMLLLLYLVLLMQVK
jgi:uncharacterized membrane protein